MIKKIYDKIKQMPKGSKIKILLGVLAIVISSAGLVATSTLVKKPKKETPSLAASNFPAIPTGQTLYQYPFSQSPNERAGLEPAGFKWQYFLSAQDFRDENPGNFNFNLDYQGKTDVMSINGIGALTTAFPENIFGSSYIIKTSFYDSGTTPAGVFLSLTSNVGYFDSSSQGITVGIWTDQFTNQIAYFHTGNTNRYGLKSLINRAPNTWHDLELIVTPKGSYARYDGKNLATIPNQEGAKSVYKNYPSPRRITVGNIYNTLGTYYYDKIEVTSIPAITNPRDISRYFVRKAVENQPTSDPQFSLIWQIGLLAMDQYFNSYNHANEIKTLGNQYATNLNLDFISKPYDFIFSVINPHAQDLWLLSGVWNYLDSAAQNQITDKWAKALNQLVTNTDPAKPYDPTNPNFYNSLYSFCPEYINRSPFPYSSWEGNSLAEETGWPAEVLVLGSALFNQHPNAPKWKEYARFYAFHTFTKNESLAQTGSIFTYLPDNLKNWSSRTIFDDGSMDNHAFHPNPQYASGSVNLIHLMDKFYQKLGQPAFPELFHNADSVYQKSVLPYIDTEYWRWRQTQIYEWFMTYGYWGGDWPCNPDSAYPRWCELNPNYPLGSPQARKLGQVGPLKNSSDCPTRPFYGTSGLSDWGIAPYYFYQIANLVGNTDLEQKSAEFDYYILQNGNNIFTCVNGCDFKQSISLTAIVYLFFSTNYPVNSFQLPLHNCSVSLSSSQITEGSPVTVTFSGNPSSGQKVKLWLTGLNGQPLTGVKFNGSDPQLSPYDNKSYYLLSEAADTNSHSGNLTAPAGKYFLHCDVNYNPFPCSGNPFCDYNRDTCSNSGSSSCKSVNCTALGNVTCSENDNKLITINNPVESNLNFQVKFQGIGSQVANKTVRVILKQAGVEKYRFDNLTVSANSSGIFTGTVSNLTPGIYDIYVKGLAHLQKKFASINITNGSNNQNWSTSPLMVGDFDNNNVLNITDVSNQLSNFTGLSVPVNSTSQKYDVDANNLIDINDISLVLTNYTALQVEGDKENL